MVAWLARLIGHRIVHKRVIERRAPGLDMGLGFALLRDRRVPAGKKLLALLLGLGAVVLLMALEVPVESVIALLLNVAGLGIDAVADGLEMIVGPLLLGSLFILRLAPAEVVARLRAERGRHLPAGT